MCARGGEREEDEGKGAVNAERKIDVVWTLGELDGLDSSSLKLSLLLLSVRTSESEEKGVGGDVIETASCGVYGVVFPESSRESSAKAPVMPYAVGEAEGTGS